MTVLMWGGVDLVADLKRTFGSDLLAVYTGGEQSGATMLDSSGNSFNGTYSGTTPIGASPFGSARRLDAVNDGALWYSAGIDAAWSWSAYTLLMPWARINSAGVWSDATTRYGLRVVNGALSAIGQIAKHTTANQIQFQVTAGGVNAQNVVDLGGTLDPFSAALTFSDANDRMRSYTARKGVAPALVSEVAQVNSPSGALDTTRCIVGALSSAAYANGWDGDLWPVVIIKREATLAELYPFLGMVV
jgi:hypothetical protein